jgi:SAM-dependent methyltransferase
MGDKNAVFDGSIPENYDRFLGPFIFEPYAENLVGRLELPPQANVLEVACGTGIVTRRIAERLGAGFAEVRLDWVGLESQSPSARDLAIGIIQGNPILHAIRERRGVGVDRVQAAVEEGLRARFGSGPVRTRTRALVVAAGRGV